MNKRDLVNEVAEVVGTKKAAQEAVVTAIGYLDRAAEKGVIHPNNAARRKSRLVKKLNEAQTLASTEDSTPAS